MDYKTIINNITDHKTIIINQLSMIDGGRFEINRLEFVEFDEWDFPTTTNTIYYNDEFIVISIYGTGILKPIEEGIKLLIEAFDPYYWEVL